MIRLALVGVSGTQAYQLAEAVRRIRELEITAIVHDHELCNAGMLQGFEDGVIATTLEDLLANHTDALDAAMVCSPLSRRVSDACQLAMAGKHVLVRTPIANSVDEVGRLLNACHSAGVKLMVGNSWRFRPSMVAIQRALESGKLGRPVFLRIHAWTPQTTALSDGPLTQFTISQTTRDLVDLLDMTQGWFEELPTEVFAIGVPGIADSNERYVDLQTHLSFPSDGMALVSLAHSLPLGAGYHGITLIGSSGAAYADDHNQSQLLYRGGHPSATIAREEQQAFVGMFRAFVESIKQDQLPRSTAVDARDAIILADAVLQSAAHRCPVRRRGDTYEPR